MEPASPANEEQAALWNGPAARAWVTQQALLDGMFEPLEHLLAQALPAAGGGRLLDVGCGTGGTTLAFARRLGAAAQCTGIDISAPMIALARERAQREASSATFVAADAQVHAFEPAGFDHIVSRFGVMFFDDPVAAFANLRCAARPGATMQFLAWRSAAENPFMTTAERAAAPLLPQLPPRRPGGPGQFAFAERDRVAAILRDSGWTVAEIRPVDVTCGFPERELASYVRWMGPVGNVLQGADEATREKVVAAVTAAFAPFVSGNEVRYTAACWHVSARAEARD
jgi:SAM-dependent methyltransferase